MNILFITIGNSDIQFKNETKPLLEKWGINVRPNERQEQSGYLLLNHPRNGGEVIINNYEVFESFLEFPIVLPAIKEILQNRKETVAQIWLVFTDQIDEKQKPKDTLFFAKIIEKYFSTKYSKIEFIDYCISQNPVNIDFQYRDFYLKGKKIIEKKNDIEKLYILPQGGIDQINYALTLQFIQLFKTKLVLFQKAEGADLIESHFPELFLNDLLKNSIVNYINDYHFEKALSLLEVYKFNNLVIKLSKNAAGRLGMRHEDNHTFCLNNCSRDEQNNIGKELFKKLNIHFNGLTNYEKLSLKLADMVIQCKIDFAKRYNYNDAFVKLFTILENLFKLKIEEKFSRKFNLSHYAKNSEIKLNDNNEHVSPRWLLFLNCIDSKLIAYLDKITIQSMPLQFKIPKNRATYFYIYKYLLEKKIITSTLSIDQLKSFYEDCEKLAGMRNNIAHNLGHADKREVEKIYNNGDFSALFKKIELFSGVSGYGVFEDIKTKALELIG